MHAARKKYVALIKREPTTMQALKEGSVNPMTYALGLVEALIRAADEAKTLAAALSSSGKKTWKEELEKLTRVAHGAIHTRNILLDERVHHDLLRSKTSALIHLIDQGARDPADIVEMVKNVIETLKPALEEIESKMQSVAGKSAAQDATPFFSFIHSALMCLQMDLEEIQSLAAKSESAAALQAAIPDTLRSRYGVMRKLPPNDPLAEEKTAVPEEKKQALADAASGSFPFLPQARRVNFLEQRLDILDVGRMAAKVQSEAAADAGAPAVLPARNGQQTTHAEQAEQAEQAVPVRVVG